jgi:hypothetical protein
MKTADSVDALTALQNFVGFCGENHKAKNYILFLVGHGLIVGHDSFLPDDNPVSAVTLSKLHDTLDVFNKQITKDGGTLQLLALHSCSMSAAEVAYELRGQAKYMMASEGISYIGSWPYRQLLMKLFRNVVKTKGGDPGSLDEGRGGAEPSAAAADGEAVGELIENLYFLSFFNAKDYEHSGYSLDLSLCSLDEDSYKPLTESLRGLVRRMMDALPDESPRGQIIKELILLAHWESQSYWNESYTDLFDFCKCLQKRCASLLAMLDEFTDASKTAAMHDDLGGLSKSCSDVMDVLSEERPAELAARSGPIVIRSRPSGPQYQYSHGLSVYFPWSKPVDDGPRTRVCVRREGEQVEEEVRAEQIMERYKRYRFNSEMEGESWADFLESYFEMTQRKTRRKEDEESGLESVVPPSSEFFNHTGIFAGNPMAALTKGAPSTGDDCTCASIKNYPTTEIKSDGKSRRYTAF